MPGISDYENEVMLEKSRFESKISQEKELNNTQESFASFSLSEPDSAFPANNSPKIDLDAASTSTIDIDMPDKLFSDDFTFDFEQKNPKEILELKNQIVDDLVSDGYKTQHQLQDHEVIWALNTCDHHVLNTTTIIDLVLSHREWLAQRQGFSDAVKSQLK